MRDRPRLLVTGFGPFPGMPRNPSGRVARLVAASPRWRLLGAEVQALVLATRYAAIPETLVPALAAPDPAVLMIGVAGRSTRVRIEQRALNRASVLYPDAQGRRATRLALQDGPGFRRSLVPTAPVAVLLRQAGVACRASQDAGRYLCNAAYFEVLGRGAPALFLHIPKPPRPRRGRPAARPGLPFERRLASAFVTIGADLLRRTRTARPP